MRLPQTGHTVHVAQGNLLQTGQGVEIREVGDPGQADHRNVHQAPLGRALEAVCEGVLIVQIQGQIGYHPHHLLPCELLQHGEAWVQNGLVSPELVDHQALNSGLLLRLQEGHCAVQGGKDAPPVNVPAQKHRAVCQGRHAHVHDVVFFEVDLRRTPRPLYDEDVILRRQGAVGRQNIGNQRPLHGEIVPGGHIPPDLPIHNHLGPCVSRRLQQDGVHPHRGLHPRRLRLHHLGPAHFQALVCDVGVEGHILRLKRSHPVAVLGKNPAQRRRQEALSRVGGGPLNHDCFCHAFPPVSARTSSRASF